MNPLAHSKLHGQVADGLATDSRSLDSLKRAARNDPKAALKQAATQFESLFMQMVLKSMRDAMPKSGLLDSSAQQMYTGMLDQQLSGRIATGGTGLADVIARQLGQHIGIPDKSAAAAKSGAAEVPSAAPANQTLPASAAQGGKRSPQSPDPSRAAVLDAVPAAVPVTRNASSAQRDAVLAARNPYSAQRDAWLSALRAPAENAALTGAGAASSTAINARSTDGATEGATDSANLTKRAFVTRTWDHALAAQRATGIPARFVVGQAALESGWGKNEIRTATGQPSHNLFGIKAGSNWRGPTVEVTTTEFENGVPKRVVEKFRAYSNYTEAFRDWARLIGDNPRYAGVLANASDASGFANALQRAGYATDPAYGAKLTRVIGALSGMPAAMRGKA